MKRSALLLVLVLALTKVIGQTYLISFTGMGAASAVDSVKIENLMQCTSLLMNGNDTLQLNVSVGIKEAIPGIDKSLHIYPNPLSDHCFLEFEAPASNNGIFKIYDITGNLIFRENTFVVKGPNKFMLNGLGIGMYLIHIETETHAYTGKLISNLASKGPIEINNIQTTSDFNHGNKLKMTLKSSNSMSNMPYTMGDRLKLTGFSAGMYRTVMILTPANSQTVTFNFVDCTDGDGIHYSIVQIGTQTWMAENLRTTKYRNGSSITYVPDSTQWKTYSNGAYCNYNNTTNSDSVNTFGRLYNWYAVSGTIAPNGWHVPSDAEWTTLTNYLGGAAQAGGKLKQNCTTLWDSPNTAASNESGFTAVPGGTRGYNGLFAMPSGQYIKIGKNGYYWSSTDAGSSSPHVWFRTLNFSNSNINSAGNNGWNNDKCGFSLRCVKD